MVPRLLILAALGSGATGSAATGSAAISSRPIGPITVVKCLTRHSDENGHEDGGGGSVGGELSGEGADDDEHEDEKEIGNRGEKGQLSTDPRRQA